MKHTIKKLYLLLIISLLAAGCIKDDLGDCPPKPNTTVRFSLEDYSGNEIFPSTVERAELFVYDNEGMLVSRSHISKGELNAFMGKRLYLTPGTYNLVIWANAIRSQIVVNENIHWSNTTNNHVLTAIPVGGVIDDGDPLYYAPEDNSTPLTVVVPEQGEVEVTATLRHAHVKLDVTIEGYDIVSRNNAIAPLQVEVTDLTSRYSFGMDAHGELLSYCGTAVYTGSEDWHNRMFNIPVFDVETPTKVLVTDRDGELILPTIRLSELLNEKIDLDKLRYLPILVRFFKEGDAIKVEVKVDLPGWDEGVVTPNI